jgi:hypothetical protein
MMMMVTKKELPPPVDRAGRLRKARQERGFRTAKAAADFFGWNINTYGQHENGTRDYDREAKRYATAFKVSEGWLLTGEGPASGMRSIDAELAALPRDDREELYETFLSAIEIRHRRLKDRTT